MGFGGGRFERAFFDVRVFNPHAPTNRQPQLSSCYRRHENAKKRVYDQRIREVEHNSFVPLVMSVTGGLGRIATTTYKRLASMLSSKWNQPYSTNHIPPPSLSGGLALLQDISPNLQPL